MKIVFDDGVLGASGTCLTLTEAKRRLFAHLNHVLTGARHPVDVRLAPTGTECRPTRFRSDLFQIVTIFHHYGQSEYFAIY